MAITVVKKASELSLEDSSCQSLDVYGFTGGYTPYVQVEDQDERSGREDGASLFKPPALPEQYGDELAFLPTFAPIPGRLREQGVRSTSALLRCLQEGIEHTLKSEGAPSRDLLMSDFTCIDTHTFSCNGPLIANCDFVFRRYSPYAFWYLRKLFGISSDSFQRSMCREPLVKLRGGGASGSLFYISYDDRFILKTVEKSEAKFLQKMLPGYYLNLSQNSRTLLPKYFGIFACQRGPHYVRVVVTNNLLPTTVALEQQFDLKGSTFNRRTGSPRFKGKVGKDLDFLEDHPCGFYLHRKCYLGLMDSIERDCRVLESFDIMDYSLLLAVCYPQLPKSTTKRIMSEKNVVCTKSGNGTTTFVSTNSSKRVFAGGQPFASLMNAFEARDMRGEKVIVFAGIIDILQSYRFRKRVEYFCKSLLHDGRAVSVNRPDFYSQRFRQFIRDSVFKCLPYTSRTKDKKVATTRRSSH